LSPALTPGFACEAVLPIPFKGRLVSPCYMIQPINKKGDCHFLSGKNISTTTEPEQKRANQANYRVLREHGGSSPNWDYPKKKIVGIFSQIFLFF
jgi:hypothetical protein